MYTRNNALPPGEEQSPLTAFPVLRGNRLELSRPTYRDVPALIELGNNPRVTAPTYSMPHPYYEEDAIYFLHLANQSFVSGESYRWAIREKSSGHFLGAVGLHLSAKDRKAELGYWLGEPYWGRGYASEAAGLVLNYAFDVLDLYCVQAACVTDNVGSVRVLEKIGMLREGVRVADSFRNGEYRDIFLYRLTAPERSGSVL